MIMERGSPRLVRGRSKHGGQGGIVTVLLEPESDTRFCRHVQQAGYLLWSLPKRVWFWSGISYSICTNLDMKRLPARADDQRSISGMRSQIYAFHSPSLTGAGLTRPTRR